VGGWRSSPDGFVEVVLPAFRFDELLATCDICAGLNFDDVDLDARIMACRTCGYRFVNPRPSQPEIASTYSDPSFYDGWVADDAGRSVMWAKRLRLVERMVTGRRLLDIGAGMGTFLALARNHGWEVAGTEVSTSARRLARDRYSLDLLYGQAEDLPLEPNSFDVITLWHVLEHVPSPSRLLHACRKALVADGTIVIAVPNDAEAAFIPGRLKRSILSIDDQRQSFKRYEPLVPGGEIHLSHFTLPVISRLLRTEGLRVAWVSVDDHSPRPTWITNLRVGLYRFAHRLSHVNVGKAMVLIAN
jgi:SAM-dependent methyltransferase